MFPNKVLTKQCAGFCKGNTVCSAVKAKNVSFSVQVLQEDGTTQCSTILVPQDIKCKCKCAITEKSCTSLQAFNKSVCACECSNMVRRTLIFR